MRFGSFVTSLESSKLLLLFFLFLKLFLLLDLFLELLQSAHLRLLFSIFILVLSISTLYSLSILGIRLRLLHNLRGRSQTQRQSQLICFQLRELENLLIFHQVDTLDVADAGLFCEMFDGRVFSIKLLQSWLNGQSLIWVGIQLLQRDISFVHSLNEFGFLWGQEEEGITL